MLRKRGGSSSRLSKSVVSTYYLGTLVPESKHLHDMLTMDPAPRHRKSHALPLPRVLSGKCHHDGYPRPVVAHLIFFPPISRQFRL